jgi:hypothetical protein
VSRGDACDRCDRCKQPRCERSGSPKLFIPNRNVLARSQGRRKSLSQRTHVSCELPQPPPRGDHLSGVPAMLVVAIAWALGSARVWCAAMHPAAPSPGYDGRPAWPLPERVLASQRAACRIVLALGPGAHWGRASFFALCPCAARGWRPNDTRGSIFYLSRRYTIWEGGPPAVGAGFVTRNSSPTISNGRACTGPLQIWIRVALEPDRERFLVLVNRVGAEAGNVAKYCSLVFFRRSFGAAVRPAMMA